MVSAQPAAGADGRIRLVEFLTNFKFGGTERQVVNLVRALDRSRFDMHVACLGRYGEFLEDVEGCSVPVTEYPIRRLYGPTTLRRQAAFARYLRQHAVQVVHSFGFYANVFGVPAARAAGVPVVLASIRDTGDHLSPARKLVQRQVCRLADRVLVNAEAVRRSLISEGYAPYKIVRIPNGIDISPFQAYRRRAGLRQELGVPEGVPVVAVLSRLNELKGVEYFLKAAAAVHSRLPDTHFLLVGDSAADAVGETYKRGLEAQAARMGLARRVIFTGFRSDIPELLAEVSVSVLPSLSEGLSNALLETMAAGVPVVATNVGGNPEIVEDGVTGLLVPPRDAYALAGAMLRLMASPELQTRLGWAGRRLVSRQFSLEQMARRTESLYLRALEAVTHPPLALSLGKVS
jgi:glycosyltransferase involved in cell wall biosynthesis